MTTMKIFWTILLALIGAVVGGVLLGSYTNWWLALVGAPIGFGLGGLLGYYIPWYEWFT